MSDISLPHCETCKEPNYACRCDEGLCCSCGEPLGVEALKVGRDECFSCFCERND